MYNPRLCLRDAKRLRYGFFFFLLVLPLYGFPLVNVGSRALQWDWFVAMGIIGSFVEISAFRERQFSLHFDRITFGLLIFNGALVLSLYTPLTGGIEMVTNHTTTWAQYLIGSGLFVAVTHTRFRRPKLLILLRLYLLVATLVALLGLGQFFAANALGIEWVYFDLPNAKWEMSSGYFSVLGFKRATSIFAEPRHFGNFLVTPFFVLAVTLKSSLEPFEPPVHLLASMLVLAGIIVSFSASAYLVFLVSVAFVPVLVSGNLRMSLERYARIGGLVVAMGTIIAMSPISSGDFLFTLRRLLVSGDVMSAAVQLDFDTLAQTGNGRYIGGALAAIILFVHNPLVGVGLNQFYSYYPELWILPPFDLVASTGFLGTATFTYFLVSLFREPVALRSRVSNLTDRWFLHLALVLVSTAVLKSTMGSNYNYPSMWFWFDISFAGVIYYTVLSHRRDSGSDE